MVDGGAMRQDHRVLLAGSQHDAGADDGLVVAVRVGAINLEQLDLLLESLKSYWDYSSQKNFLDEVKSSPTTPIRAENQLAYEL